MLAINLKCLAAWDHFNRWTDLYRQFLDEVTAAESNPEKLPDALKTLSAMVKEEQAFLEAVDAITGMFGGDGGAN